MDVIPNYDIVEEKIDYSALKASSVVDKINSLKQNYQLILTLNLIEGYDYEEIAQIMEYTNENVRTTISRAKKKLKQVLLEDTTNTQMYGR
jgi:RNA polymerase sigma-70 factor (ECF subfamily)